jgi:Glutamine amidotransferases class-II
MIASSRIIGRRLAASGSARGFASRRVTVVSTASKISSSSSSGLLWKAASVAGQTSNGARFYSTEKILTLRSGKSDQKTLYNPVNETENCGVGLIASLKSVASRDIVEKADEMLVRMSHRGGCGCDPASGDGSGTFGSLLMILFYFMDHDL